MPNTDMRYAVVIPARFQSSRLPGKPLVQIAGKSLIFRVWEKCTQAVDGSLVFIATDDNRIREHCMNFTNNVVMTSDRCLTGTDRVAEVAKMLNLDFVINVQGDEPLINPEDIKTIISAHLDNPGCIINGMCPIRDENEYHSLTIPKVVTDLSGRLLYMSRSPIPGNKNNVFRDGMKQVCIYAFQNDALQDFSSRTQKTPLEEQEDIEILRFLEIGYTIKMVHLEEGSVAVDTPQDVITVENIINERTEEL